MIYAVVLSIHGGSENGIIKEKTIWDCITGSGYLFTGGVIGYKIYRHEKRQEQEYNNLSGQVSFLQEKLEQTTEYYNFQPGYRDDTFNYLAIGNSLTLIGSWGRGICATQPDGDYFGRVEAYLSQTKGETVGYRFNFATWELMSARENAYPLLDKLLSDKLNLVTIQLGENVRDNTTYEKDLEGLISYVYQKAPKAKIVLIGDFWDKKRNQMRQQAAENTNTPFADLAPIIGDKKYQSKEGTVCELTDGSTREVSKVEETHPGDEGMAYIAAQVIEKID